MVKSYQWSNPTHCQILPMVKSYPHQILPTVKSYPRENPTNGQFLLMLILMLKSYLPKFFNQQVCSVFSINETSPTQHNKSYSSTCDVMMTSHEIQSIIDHDCSPLFQRLSSFTSRLYTVIHLVMIQTSYFPVPDIFSLHRTQVSTSTAQ